MTLKRAVSWLKVILGQLKGGGDIPTDPTETQHSCHCLAHVYFYFPLFVAVHVSHHVPLKVALSVKRLDVP